MSFGEDDFDTMRRYQSALYKLVNEQYDYSVEIIKPIDKLTYNQAWHWFVEDLASSAERGEMHHMIMASIAKRGYIKYERRNHKKT